MPFPVETSTMFRRAPAALFTLTIAFLVMCASPVHAQDSRPRKPRQGVQSDDPTKIPAGLQFADLKLGPLYLQPRVGVSELGYDSNILGSPSVAAIDDSRATVSAGTRIVVPFRADHMISGDAQVDYLWFNQTKELRTFNGAFDGRYEFEGERLESTIYSRYIDAQRGQLDVIEIGNEVASGNYEIFGRVRERVFDLGGRLQFDVGSRFVAEPRGRRRRIRYQDDPENGQFLSASLDRTEDSVGALIGYRFTAKTTLGFDTDYQINDYVSLANPRDATTRRLAGKVEFDQSAPMYGAVLAGHRKLTPTEDGIVGFEGFVLDASLAFAPGGVMEITLIGDRDVFPSYWFDSIYFLREGGGATALFQVRRSLAIGADFTYYQHGYPTEATAEQVDGTTLTAKRNDKISRVVGRLEWRQSGSTRITFRVGWVERLSNFDIATTDGLVVGGGYALVY